MIRRATEGDEAAIRDCATAAYSQYIATIGRKPAPMTADYGAHIARGEAHVAVDDAGVLLGLIVFFAEGEHMQLENVAVQSAAAGKGIGKGLVRFCEEEAQRQGCKTVQLYTNEKMTANLSLYPHLGYRELGRWQEDGFNRVYLRR